ncbi:hypothetical protein K470DRAFT_273783 [Piedraia hortae CBS 480.64]|uniref:Uncharacterized protein n=1 Tax=Piedraia hortae CBS 480.64 TaxID=1314780 RepID=A0A6A7CAK9_9PEZI|nr:hypothetical protein K470DRAFT_273783 [Piedraia hortae CBS 480.64]
MEGKVGCLGADDRQINSQEGYPVGIEVLVVLVGRGQLFIGPTKIRFTGWPYVCHTGSSSHTLALPYSVGGFGHWACDGNSLPVLSQRLDLTEAREPRFDFLLSSDEVARAGSLLGWLIRTSRDTRLIHQLAVILELNRPFFLNVGNGDVPEEITPPLDTSGLTSMFACWLPKGGKYQIEIGFPREVEDERSSLLGSPTPSPSPPRETHERRRGPPLPSVEKMLDLHPSPSPRDELRAAPPPPTVENMEEDMVEEEPVASRSQGKRRIAEAEPVEKRMSKRLRSKA